MADGIAHVSARELKAQLHDCGEIALLDAREEGVFHARHLLLASCLPLSRLELLIDDLVPRRGTRVVWCDDGDGSALRAAGRISQFGYTDVAVLDGGISAWQADGYRLYSGVHVPSKAFAEVVEHEAETPWISALDLKALIDSGADLAVFDSRSYEEYHNNSIPTAISVPGAELVYRFPDMVQSPDTTVIVNCGGRTRSIIGAQALRNAGFGNKIMSRRTARWPGTWPDSRSCTARRGGRPRCPKAAGGRLSTRRRASPSALQFRGSITRHSRRGAQKRTSAPSMFSTCGHRRSTGLGISRALAPRQAASSCRRPTPISPPGMPVSSWSTTTACGRQ
jgi:rhodanese-related sulfurtransferase